MFKKSLIALLAITSFNSSAALLELKFTDTNNEAVKKSPTDTYLNPSSNIDVVLSAGLDRKIRLTVTNSSGTTDQIKVSGTVNINDEIIVDGGNYYGKTISINQLYEGGYTLKAEILDYNDSVVQTDIYNFIVDTTAPYAGDISIYQYGDKTTEFPDVYHLTDMGGNYVRISSINISDDNGIETVTAMSFDENSLYKSKSVPYNNESNVAMLGDGVGFFPRDNAETIFELQFEVTDTAGNKSVTNRQRLFYDSVSLGSEMVAVYNPRQSGSFAGKANFEPYVSGMTVYTNPIQWLEKIPKSNYIDHHRGGEYYIGAKEVFEYGEDVYGLYERAYGMTESNIVRTAQRNKWITSGLGYSLVLDEAAPQTPVGLNNYYLYSDTGKSSWYRRIKSEELPITILGVGFDVAARDYDQIATAHGYSCNVPAGQTYCEVNFNAPAEMNPGTMGWFRSSRYIKSIDQTLVSKPSWGGASWCDKEHCEPDITNIEWEESTKELKVWVTQPHNDGYQHNLGVGGYWVESNGERLSNSATKVEVVGDNIYYEFDLKNLAEGIHNLSFKIHDKNYNYTEREFQRDYYIDNTPPTITVTNLGSETFDSIQGLSGLVIKIDDTVSTAEITEVRLEGGPVGSETNLTWRDLGDDRYSLEYPKIFPSLEENTSYQLIVIAQDSAGNSSSTTNEFNYLPPNLQNIGKVFTLPVSRNLLDANNSPIANFKSDNVRTGEGNLINGEQDLVFTLRSDADFAVIVEGRTVQPGQTVELKIQAANGGFEVPIYPAVSDIEGVAPFFAEIQMLRAN